MAVFLVLPLLHDLAESVKLYKADNLGGLGGKHKVELKQINKKLRPFLINIGTSGKYRGEREFGMSDYLIRYVLMNFICIFGFAL
ncbi:MAG: hypothetical protein LBU82_03760, partial [Treponema sp.]|nr:hypothetical protein [Treponema sp.]